MKTVDELKVGDLVRSFGQIWRVSEINGDTSISFENTDETAVMGEQAIVGDWKNKFAAQGFEIINSGGMDNEGRSCPQE